MRPTRRWPEATNGRPNRRAVPPSPGTGSLVRSAAVPPPSGGRSQAGNGARTPAPGNESQVGRAALTPASGARPLARRAALTPASRAGSLVGSTAAPPASGAGSLVGRVALTPATAARTVVLLMTLAVAVLLPGRPIATDDGSPSAPSRNPSIVVIPWNIRGAAACSPKLAEQCTVLPATRTDPPLRVREVPDGATPPYGADAGLGTSTPPAHDQAPAWRSPSPEPGKRNTASPALGAS